MPQLPSGRHVAISAEPLAKFIEAIGRPETARRIMAIDSIPELLKYFDVFYLVPEGQALAESAGAQWDTQSPVPPPGHVCVRAGPRLADWDALTQGWSDDDKAAFRDFIDVRGKDLIARARGHVAHAKTNLLQSGEAVDQVLAAFLKAGVHPAQEEGWEESDVGGPEPQRSSPRTGRVRSDEQKWVRFSERRGSRVGRLRHARGAWPDSQTSPRPSGVSGALADAGAAGRRVAGLDRRHNGIP